MATSLIERLNKPLTENKACPCCGRPMYPGEPLGPYPVQPSPALTAPQTIASDPTEFPHEK